MLTQARIYAKEMPTLEWLYFGQIRMEVSRGEEDGNADVFALSTERDECWVYLREMFGWKHGRVLKTLGKLSRVRRCFRGDLTSLPLSIPVIITFRSCTR